jgi:outer membrane receptor for ferrienterochelin and colicins
MRKSFLGFLLSLLSTLLFSQGRTDANIIGHVVTDSTHIPFATVSLKGTTIGTNTDATGHFHLVDLSPGTYIIRAQSVGYKTVEKQVIVKAGETTEVKFELAEDFLGLDEVVVTADRSEMKRNESVSIVNTLSPQLLSSTQSLTLSDVLSFSPGLRVENDCQNCGFTQVRMNGMEGPYSQILINSRSIFSGLAGVYGLELIPANMIEKVEIVRGGGSALYGSNAIAGTVNIILREPASSSWEGSLNSALIGAGLKGNGNLTPDLSATVNASVVSDDSKSGLSLFGFSRDRKMFDYNNDGFSEISQMNNMSLGTRFFRRLGSRGKLSIDFFSINEERNGGNKMDYPLHERDLAETVKHNIKTGALTFERYFRDYDMFSFFFSTQYLERDSYYGANKSLKDYGFSKDLAYNAGVQYKAVFETSSLIGGIENTGGFLTDKKLGYPDLGNAVIVNDSIVSIPHTENLLISDQSTSSTGLFFQYDLKVEKLKIGIGGRFDHFRVVDHEKADEAKTGNVVSPRLSLMYELLKNVQARVSYSMGYRAPQIYDEDLHIETSGSRQVINVNDPGLKHETSRSIMASIDVNRLIGTSLTGLLIEGFYTSLHDPFVNEIGQPDEEGKVYYTRKNAETGASVRGLNFEFKFKPLSDFSLTSGFTVQSSNYRNPQQFNRREFLRTPSDYGFFNIDWDFIRNTCFSVSGVYTGRMLVPYFGVFTDPDAGELRNSERFFDLGGRLEYDIKINGAGMKLFTGMKNVLNSYQSDFDTGIDRDPSYIYGPMGPRTVYFGIKIGNKL